MSDYISIKDDRLWQILFDEACVEGKQAERIQKELEQITLDEKEIIRKTFKRIVERLNEEMPISWEHDYIGGKKDAFVEAEIFDNEAFEAKEMAIQALEEVEQYRALGTPKEIKIREVSAAQLSKAYLSNLTELREYQSLGTVEELKEAREKQIPKKPTHKIESHSISPTTVNFETVYQCRNCHSIVKEEWNFCTLCGQKLDWEEGGTSD